MRNHVPASVVERDGDLLVDRHGFDVETGRAETERWIVRDGEVRKTRYSVRFYTFTELRSRAGEPFELTPSELGTEGIWSYSNSNYLLETENRSA